MDFNAQVNVGSSKNDLTRVFELLCIYLNYLYKF